AAAAVMAERPRRTEFPSHAVERARAILRDVGPAARGYAAVLRAGEAARLPPWRIADHGGNETHRVFARKSQARLTEGAPGLFTKSGFYAVVAPQVLLAAQSIRDNAWILDQSAGQPPISPTLEKDIFNLYFKEYARRWEELLDDLTLVDAADLRRQADLAGVMAGRESPLAKLLRAVAAETSLTGGGLSPAAQLLTAHASWAAVAALAKSEVDDRFFLLANFAGPAPSRLDNLVKALEAAHSDLLRLSKSSGPERPDTQAAQMLINETLQAPYPVKNWIETLAAKITANAVNGAREKLNAEWSANVLPWCGRVVDGRYPFSPTGVEASIDDFARLFSPGGVLDAFFDSRLRPYVDTAAPTWRWRLGEGQDLGVAPSTAVMFQTAARIRDAFFAGGGKEPRAVFDIKLNRIAGGGQQVELTVDGRTVNFIAGAPNAQQIVWPGTSGARQVLAAFPPPPAA
ncbi:MAG TPA: ImcF-related family protein, partial [Azospirillaceae bacterium]|nr:ImcF-related family protein [Azospirillaceae bacterium]